MRSTTSSSSSRPKTRRPGARVDLPPLGREIDVVALIREDRDDSRRQLLDEIMRESTDVQAIASRGRGRRMIAYVDSSVLLRFILDQPDRLVELTRFDERLTSAVTEVECLRAVDASRVRG